MFLDPRPDGEDVRVDDDVLGIEPDRVDQEPVGPGRDGDLALRGVGLPALVEGHDHDRGTIAST